MRLLRTIWAYRSLIIQSVITEHKARFAKSSLGWMWMIVQPLAQAAVLALVLSKVIMAKNPGVGNSVSYPIFLLSGMLGWSLFSELVTRGAGLFVDNATTLKKIRFPKVCLPVAALLSSLLNHLIMFVVVIAIFLLLGFTPGVDILWLPLYVFVNAAMGIGLGLLLGTLNVFSRDIGQALPIILYFWFWTTPIVYHANIVPKAFALVLDLNPITHLVRGYQNSLAYGIAPHLPSLAVLVFGSLVFLWLALKLFRRASAEITDEL